MSFMVVALLSVLWLGFFLPSLLQARRMSSPYASATTFQDSLRRLSEVPDPGDAAAVARARAPRRSEVAARRRETLSVLSAAVVAAALLALGFGGWAVWSVLPPAVALAAYVVMLRRDVVRRAAQRARLQQAHKTAVAQVAGEQWPTPPQDAAASLEPEDAPIVPSVGRRVASQPPERIAG